MIRDSRRSSRPRKADVPCAALLALAIVLPGVARAQTASQITPPSFRPNQERPGGFSLSGAAGPQTPAGAEKLFVQLEGVTVAGGFPELKAATDAIETR